MLVRLLLVEHRLEQVAAPRPRVTSERYAIRSVTQPSAYTPVDGQRTPLLLSSSSSSPSTASAAITFSRCTWTYRLYSNIFAACKSPRDFVRHPIADYLGLNETVASDIILRQIVRVARSLNVWTWPGRDVPQRL